MSRDRFYDPQEAASVPRCRKQPGHRYDKLYMGNQREPRQADEAGARCVVDLLFGGRVLLFDHDEDHMRVRMIREDR